MERRVKCSLTFVVLCLFNFIIFPTNGISKDPDYPTKAIEFIITFGAGGLTDLSCRALCETVSKYLPKSVVPVNKPGASGVVGTTLIKEAKPDGYTIGSVTRSAVFIAPFLQEVSYDPLKDFTPIIHYGGYVDPVMIRGDKPWRTWKEIVEWARNHPGEIKIAVAGSKHTQVQAIGLSRIELKENIKFTYIPFKSSLECLTAIVGGNVDVFASTMDVATWDYINTGKLRIVSYLTGSKLPGYEAIPSTEEIYGIGICNLVGVIGPKGLPSYVTKKIEEVFTKAVKEPSFARIMEKMYSPVVYMSGEEMGKYIEKTYKEQKEIIKQLKEEEAKK